MKYGVLIRNPYDGKPEAVLGPYDTREHAEAAMQTLADLAEHATPCNGIVFHPDCVGDVIPVGGLNGLNGLPPAEAPSGFMDPKDFE